MLSSESPRRDVDLPPNGAREREPREGMLLFDTQDKTQGMRACL